MDYRPKYKSQNQKPFRKETQENILAILEWTEVFFFFFLKTNKFFIIKNSYSSKSVILKMKDKLQTGENIHSS